MFLRIHCLHPSVHITTNISFFLQFCHPNEQLCFRSLDWQQKIQTRLKPTVKEIAIVPEKEQRFGYIFEILL